MSHVTLAHQGLKHLEDRECDLAIQKLSKALQSSTNPSWLLGRSKAYVLTGRFREALADADLAWNSAYNRNKRDVMIDAHYRRAVAYYRLREYANADCCCLYASRLAKGGPAVEKEDVLSQWVDENGFWTQTMKDATEQARNLKSDAKDLSGIMALSSANGGKTESESIRLTSTLRVQILSAMEKLQPDDPARKPTAKSRPAEEKLATPAVAAETKSAPAAAPTPKPVVPAGTPPRLQEFQSNDSMSVSIFSKGVDVSKFQVEFTAHSARLNPLVHPDGSSKEFVLDLWGEIDPAESKYTVTPNKVELKLKKKSPGKWPTLRGEPKPASASPATQPAAAAAPQPKQAAEPVTETKAPAPKNAGPAYPTSSRSGPKNWDKLEDDGAEDDGKDVNFFFKDLFKNATPEQQRAMMKSFTESNGTSLSTDWNDVKDRTVETSPPDGVEAKKW
jgi:suppressor of G2 allele of SKP1